VALLDEILGDARAHRAEANETDIHAASLEAEEGVILWKYSRLIQPQALSVQRGCRRPWAL